MNIKLKLRWYAARIFPQFCFKTRMMLVNYVLLFCSMDFNSPISINDVIKIDWAIRNDKEIERRISILVDLAESQCDMIN